MNQNIILEVLTIPSGGEIVLIPTERIEAAGRRTKAQAEELRRKADEKERAINGANPPKGATKEELEALIKEERAQADALESETALAIEKEKSIRERFSAHVTKVEYPFRPYTDGEKQDALAEATDYSTGSPKLDIPKYHRLLVSTCCGLDAATIRSLSPARAEALTREVVERSEPDPLRLDFLF